MGQELTPCEAQGCRYYINFWCIEKEGKLYHLNCASRLEAIGVIPPVEIMADVRYLTTV